MLFNIVQCHIWPYTEETENVLRCMGAQKAYIAGNAQTVTVINIIP
jgi:hypothetical protein